MLENILEWLLHEIYKFSVVIPIVILYFLLLRWTEANKEKLHGVIRLSANVIFVLPVLFILIFCLVCIGLAVFGVFVILARWDLDGRLIFISMLCSLFGASFTYYAIRMLRGSDIFVQNEDGGYYRFYWYVIVLIVVALLSIILIGIRYL